jgi:RHS repeat-associated protein
MPFGGEIPGNTVGRDSSFGAPDNVTQRFTAKERDAESGLDYFGARYYGSALGRFTSPDNGVDQDAGDPQSWNLYSYVRNNPLSNVDPDGRTCTHSKDAQGRDVITDTDGKGCAELYDNNVYAFGGNAGLAVLASVGEKTTNWREWVDVTRHGVEGAMYAEGVKDLAEGGLTLADWLKGARDARKLASLSGLLRDALKGKGNFGLGAGTAEDAEELGKAWVGEGATTASDGKTLVSADKLRQYRPPSFKPNLGKSQANFEARWEPGGQWQTNGHLDIK